MSDGAAPRVAAAQVVAAVIHDGRSLDDALAGSRKTVADKDLALTSALAYGVLRDYRYLAALLKPMLKRVPQPRLHALLMVGVYQLRSMRVPAHAAVHATVAAAPGLGLGKARGMVNAVLRRCQRDMAMLEAGVPAQPVVRYSHPDWLTQRIQADWGEQALTVLQANNTPAPMFLRVNRRKLDRQSCLATLAAHDIEASAVADAADAVLLQAPVSTAELPGFAEGHVSVQDLSAQRAVELLQPAAGQRVLDACAAPGNKTAHVLEHADVDMLALDVDADRLATLQANLQRLQLHVHTQAADAAHPEAWWDGRPFDRILLDAPCSGTGVIRRHPDIKWLRRGSDIKKARRRQRALLEALWPLLAPGGRLLYATCSILRAEGVAVVQPFVETMADAEVVTMSDEWGAPEAVGRRIAPGEQGADGFYYACLRRV